MSLSLFPTSRSTFQAFIRYSLTILISYGKESFVKFFNKCLFLNMKMGFLAISYIFKFVPHTETYILSLYSMLYDNFDFLW